MAIGSADIHFYRKFSRRIFHGIVEEIGVEGITLYHHQKEIVQSRARSNFTPMFA
jgi:hypothetical protein